MRLIYEETVTITPDLTDASGILRSSAALRLTQAAAGHHCDLLGLDEAVMAQKGLFWAIIRNYFTVESMPAVGQTITLETWPMPTTRTCFPRACIARDTSGKELFACHSLWILMDRQTRAMVLPGKSGVDVPGVTLEHTPPAPKSLSPICADATAARQVKNEDLDQNGHMNNARYLDWAEAALDGDFRQNARLRHATLCYLNEAKLGQNLTSCTGFDANGAFLFDLRRAKEDGSFDRIFSARLEYDNIVM